MLHRDDCRAVLCRAVLCFAGAVCPCRPCCLTGPSSPVRCRSCGPLGLRHWMRSQTWTGQHWLLSSVPAWCHWLKVRASRAAAGTGCELAPQKNLLLYSSVLALCVGCMAVVRRCLVVLEHSTGLGPGGQQQQQHSSSSSRRRSRRKRRRKRRIWLCTRLMHCKSQDMTSSFQGLAKIIGIMDHKASGMGTCTGFVKG